MIDADSPLRRLPRGLSRRQILFVDALRVSAEMAALSYHRLETLVRNIVRGEIKDAESGVVIEAITDAFTIIDTANRFREVLRVFPGLKQNEVFQLFIRKTAAVESLRDIVQHLNRELTNVAESQAAPLGTLTWLGPSPTPDSPPTAWILQPGSFYPGQGTFGPNMDLESRLSPGEIDKISLVTSGVRVDLTDLISRLETMVKSLEPSIREQVKGKELLGSDVVMHFEMVPVEQTNERAGKNES